MSDLPFTCPGCGERFGFGPDAVLLAVVSSVPVNGEPAPCCGHPLTGTLRRVGEHIEFDPS